MAAGAVRAMSPSVEVWLTTEDGKHSLAEQAPLALCEAKEAGRFVLKLDPAVTYQTILGLGASLEHTTCANLWKLSPEKRAEVVERLVSPDRGIGMNLMRICMGTPDFTGDPWYSYNDMPPGEKDPDLSHFSIERDRAYILPVLKLALEKNPELKFYATPWSPPGWMKTSDDLIGGQLYPRYYKVYARYFLKFIEAYGAEGVPIHAVTVQNEPGVNKRDDVKSWWYPSCQWSLVEDEDTWWPVSRDVMGHAERDFIRDHLGPALSASGLPTKVWCFDHNFNNLWYPRNILSDASAAKYVDGTAFHPYVGEATAMSELKKEFPDKKVYLSEGSAFGLEGAANIVSYLRNGASSYNAWVTIADSKGEPNNGPFEATETCITLDAETLEVRYNFDYYIYGHYMKFIRRGAVRIDSSGELAGVDHVAFTNPNGSHVLIVVNRGSAPQSWGVCTSATSFDALLPAKSISTFAWRD
jgi:glucosylceramidase